ncbi:serine protease [Patescibacteria group bacterium]|nr:serine protease [Patescibacteria group bacterium]MBU1473135.1 serine protease [Patescibacteria group bacterium]
MKNKSQPDGYINKLRNASVRTKEVSGEIFSVKQVFEYCLDTLFLGVRVIMTPLYVYLSIPVFLNRYFLEIPPLIRAMIYSGMVLLALFFFGFYSIGPIIFFMSPIILAALFAAFHFFWNALKHILSLVSDLTALFQSAKKPKGEKVAIRALRASAMLIIAAMVRNGLYISVPIVCLLLLIFGLRVSRYFREQLFADLRECNIAESIERVKKATVAVVNYDNTYDLIPDKELSRGTGTIIRQDGFILTAAHVIEKVIEGENVGILFQDGKVIPAIGVLYDKQADMAVLKINGENYPSVKFHDKQYLSPYIFEPLFALGTPSDVPDNRPNQAPIDALVQWDTNLDVLIWKLAGKLHPGYSGGPIFTVCGDIIGIGITSLPLRLPYVNQGAFITTALSSETIQERIEDKLGFSASLP